MEKGQIRAYGDQDSGPGPACGPLGEDGGRAKVPARGPLVSSCP